MDRVVNEDLHSDHFWHMYEFDFNHFFFFLFSGRNEKEIKNGN